MSGEASCSFTSTEPTAMVIPEPKPQSPGAHADLHDRKLTVISLIGCVLEWYDFAAYGFFSDIIGQVFFPPTQSDGGTDSTATVEAYVIFGVAFLMRPIGALLMGNVGDTRSRRTALTTSMFLMAISTLLLGVLPTYKQVGTWAYVLLLIMRLLQGLSAGGNLLTSLVYTTENHKPQYRGLYAGVMLSATFVGLLLGSMVSAILRAVLTHDQLLAWGWRIPFLAGFVAILAALYLKYRGTDAYEQRLNDEANLDQEAFRSSSTSKVTLPMADAPMLEAPTAVRSSCTERRSGSAPRRPIRAMFARDNLTTVAGAFCMSVVSAFGLYFTFVWLATYMVELSPHTISNAYTVNSINIVIATFIELPLAGFLSDLYGRKRIMTIGAVGLIVLSPLVMMWISLGNFSIALASLVALGAFYALYVSSLFAWFVDSFEARIRSTSLGVIYNTAQALVGGFAPTIATLLVTTASSRTGSAPPAYFLRPGFLVSGLAALALAGLWLIAPSPEHPASDEPSYQVPTWSSLLSRKRPIDSLSPTCPAAKNGDGFDAAVPYGNASDT